MRTNIRRRIGGAVAAMLIVTLLSPQVQAIPPDPDNAALLYYQALLIHHEPNDTIASAYQDFVSGKTGPTDKIRQYVASSCAALDYATLASKVQDCDWGLPYSKGFSMLLSHLSHYRSLARLIVADARIEAHQGRHETALDRCFLLQRMADHLGDDTLVSYLVGLTVRDQSYACMEDVIGRAWNDATLLRWLRSELAKPPMREISPVRPFQIEREIVMDLMRTERVRELASTLGGELEQKEAERVAAGANEQVLGRARRMYSERVQEMLDVLAGPMSYREAHSQLRQLKDDSDPADPASVLAGAFAPAMSRVYGSKIRTESHANAVRAGIGICLHRAETGKLPATLPPGLPKDLFSGEDFEYRRTDNGFVLRCRAKDLDKDLVHEYAFTLR